LATSVASCDTPICHDRSQGRTIRKKQPVSPWRPLKEPRERQEGLRVASLAAQHCALWFHDEARIGKSCARVISDEREASAREVSPPGALRSPTSSPPPTSVGTRPSRWSCPRPAASTTQEFLDQFARFADQARWHAANGLAVPENAVFFPLPSYWPELDPALTSIASNGLQTAAIA
jgi:hypothetical protein